jgi:hypothetical protein
MTEKSLGLKNSTHVFYCNDQNAPPPHLRVRFLSSVLFVKLAHQNPVRILFCRIIPHSSQPALYNPNIA